MLEDQVDRGKRVSRDAVNVDNRVLVAVGWDVNLSMGGRMLHSMLFKFILIRKIQYISSLTE